MSLTSLMFYIFLPICIFVFFMLPSKVRYIWLLVCSYFFYSTLDGAFLSLLIVSTIITWICGDLISRFSERKYRLAILWLGIIINISFLLIYKYENFFLELSGSNVRLNLILPAGISFYTFQSLTYIIDIYRGKLDPEKNNVRGKEAVISTDDSKVKILLIPTNEELMIAMDTYAIVTK